MSTCYFEVCIHTHTPAYTHTNTHVHQIAYTHTRTLHTHPHPHHRMQLHRMNQQTSPPLTSTGELHPLPTQLPSTSNCHWRSSFGRPSNPIQNLVTLYMVPLLPGSLPILIPSRFVVVQQRLVYFYPVAGPVLVSST